MAEYGAWRYVRLTGEPGADGETSPRLEVTAVSPAVITIDRRTTNYPTVELDLVAHHWPEGQEYIVTLNGTEVYPNEDEERATGSANFIHEYESFPSGKYITFHVSCSDQSVDFDVDIPVDDVTQTQLDFGLSGTLPQGTVLNGDVFIPTVDIELEDETVIHAYQPCMYDGTTWVELGGSDGNQLVVKHLGEITAITQGSDIPSTAVVYTAIVNSLFAQNVVTENLTVGESSTLLGSINSSVIQTLGGSPSQTFDIQPPTNVPPFFSYAFTHFEEYMNIGGAGRNGKWEVTMVDYPSMERSTRTVTGRAVALTDTDWLYGPGGEAGTLVTSSTKQFPSKYGPSFATAEIGGDYGWGGNMEGHFPITRLDLTIKNYIVLLSGLTYGNPETKWYVQVLGGGIIAEGTFPAQSGTQTQQTTTVRIDNKLLYPNDVIQVILEPKGAVSSVTANKRGSVTVKGLVANWSSWMADARVSVPNNRVVIFNGDPSLGPGASVALSGPLRDQPTVLSTGEWPYQIKEYNSNNELVATWGPAWEWNSADYGGNLRPTDDFNNVARIDYLFEEYNDDPDWSLSGTVYNGRVSWAPHNIFIYDSDGNYVAYTGENISYKNWEVSFTWQGTADICHLKTPTPFEDDPLKSIGTYTDHWSEAWIDTIHGSVEGTITDARDAEYAQKIGKFGHTSQIGSASQPVYVNSNGVVTAGNSIPDVSNLATKTELSNGLSTKANISNTEGIYSREIEKDKLTYEANHSKTTVSYSRFAQEYDSVTSGSNDKRIQLSVANGLQYGERAYGSTGDYTLNAWEISPSGVFDGHLKEVENIDNVSWMSETEILNYLNND